ncbi:MAG: DUF6056 family protein [Butyrivibrio sp.]|nr:DUF6056 family protein [Butyrivibrio sp.]
MNKRSLIYILIIVFALSLIPLYAIGGCAHPSVDDYHYGAATSKVWQETGSLGEVLGAAARLTKDSYNTWQGNFTAVFLMYLQPAIWGEQFYVLVPVLLITAFAASMLAFMYTFLRKWFGAGKTASAGTAIAVTFCAMQFTHVPSDSFYWYNGSVYYTFFFSLMLVLFTLVTVIIKSKSGLSRGIALAFAIFLAFIIGGGNYATALFTAVVLAVLTVWNIISKKKTSIMTAAVAAALLASFFISVAAPGNALRQNSVGGNQGVLRALIYSFAYGGYNIASATTFPVAVMWLALLPVFYGIAARTGFKFRRPALMLAFTFGIFCSQGTAVFYAQGLRIPYRMMNIIYFCYYIFMTLNLIYIMGWLHGRFGDKPVFKALENAYKAPRRVRTAVVLAVCAFAVGCVGRISISESDSERGSAVFGNMPMSVSASLSLINGDAAAYDRELTERSEYLSHAEGFEAAVPPLSAAPEVIFHTDITEDSEYWINKMLADYYGLASVRLEHRQEDLK